MDSDTPTLVLRPSFLACLLGVGSPTFLLAQILIGIAASERWKSETPAWMIMVGRGPHRRCCRYLSVEAGAFDRTKSHTANERSRSILSSSRPTLPNMSGHGTLDGCRLRLVRDRALVSGLRVRLTPCRGRLDATLLTADRKNTRSVDHRSRLELVQRIDDSRKTAVQKVFVAGKQLHSPPVAQAQGAVAVELDLMHPIGAVRWLIDQ